jgi:hypothetical protein
MTFLSKENIELLWDVLLDEPIIKGISKTNQDIVYNAFYKNMFTFSTKNGAFSAFILINFVSTCLCANL